MRGIWILGAVALALYCGCGTCGCKNRPAPPPDPCGACRYKRYYRCK